MDENTIVFLRSLCSKIKDIATLCDTYLEQEDQKSKKEPASASDASGVEQNRLIPLTKWPEHHNWPTIGALRAMIFSSHTTGADYFIRRSGRRLLINEKAFFEWANMSLEQRILSSPNATRWREKYAKK